MKLLIVLSLFVVYSEAAKGKCPKVETFKNFDLEKSMGLWWRPFRSVFFEGEPPFKCLTTKWSNLNGNVFKVEDFNVDATTNNKINWVGNITAHDDDKASWSLIFENGNKVEAQILDQTDNYLFFYSCSENKDGHKENAVIFTRTPEVSADNISEVFLGSLGVVMKNSLDVSDMNLVPINNSNC